ncbi:hypothetical protein L593_01175 [Salinarchaeum sp. Harcht-Bsk1]|uniref:DUF1611 domain-containing protein n=1 Tax=Salinarchaeum sp. Harcht-Bsk1 TaxID=1333523 RepID=UPI000342330C|nr:DUF1611 domain-containing protein [Salinarchaeum sp. Harcht-Bsk1]AGN00188.1 hypothetical protein L593_01175 [Salinarchaeum sp. Harcht-Bsk1]
MRVAILAHEKFPDRAKTAVGICRYGEQDVVAVLDRDRAGDRVADHVPDVQDAPIVESMADAPACDALVIGIAPIGGDFDPSWRSDVRTALERGCDVLAGLHYPLAEDEEFVTLAAEHDCELRDVREPPDDLDVSRGTAGDVDAHVIATVGTDCSTGKLTTTLELVDALRAEGLDAAAVPTGQTGILIEGWGIAVDRAISDYAAGAAERLVENAAAEHDVLVVEGQGSILHPAYSGVTASLLHGAMPDALVLCHEAGREAIHGYEAFAIPPASEVASRYEQFVEPVAPAAVVAGALNTSRIEGEDEAQRAVEEFGAAIDAPATDPVRFEASEVVDGLVPEDEEAAQSGRSGGPEP